MSGFSSEDTPLPVVQGVTNSIKEAALLQFYRSISNSTGFQLTVNSTTTQLLPSDAYNVQEAELGIIEFKDGNTAVIKKTATFVHNVYISMYSTTPNVGIVAIDVIDANGNSIRQNVIASKNITPNSAEPLVMTFIHRHTDGDELRLRWGGGKVPGGTDIELNIISIQWTIVEK